MDIGLQVSFSETFNIVAADFVSNHIPVVVSKEINWASPSYYADPTNFDDIVSRMTVAKFESRVFFFDSLNLHGLKRYNEKSVHYWTYFLKSMKS